jgi:hypothetical protein
MGLGVQLTVFGVKGVAVAGVLAAAVGGAVIAQADEQPHAAQATGGLALSSPGGVKVDRPAQAGAVNTLHLQNNSKEALDVKVEARTWKQSSDGVVVANRRGTLGGVRISDDSFTLEPGAAKDFTVTLVNVPSAGYLYGALEIVGVPEDLAKRKGIVAGYRLVNALRYNAATPEYKLKAGSAKVRGKGKKQLASLTVRNSGNTVAPITGEVKLKSAFGTKSTDVSSTRVLPRKSVRIPLAKAGSLRDGRYTATVTLIQNKEKTTIKKKFRVR